MNASEGGAPGADASERLRLCLGGAVQGVGFRPFAYRLARELGLSGFVENSLQGVTLEIEGPPARLEVFERRLLHEQPPRAALEIRGRALLGPSGRVGFSILESDLRGGERGAVVLPDLATCESCLRELRDPRDRRYRYPFTNCTDCGPRYSIVLDLPYDRARTTMAGFVMCADCRREYEDPADRRFHAEPNACPACGPRLELLDADGHSLARGEAALAAAVLAVASGRILALKGIGGFQLVVDARSEAAVAELRRRKRREAKPFAVMLPGAAHAPRYAHVSALEAQLLGSAPAPIVLVRRRSSEIAPGVAPGSPDLGLFLPYSPLHHLLLAELGFPVVATSGNRADEPICTDEHEALDRLQGIADLYLVHDRRIARPVDDSLLRVVGGHPMLLRRARGYAPMPVASLGCARSLLAVGAHLKNAVALAKDGDVLLGPHVGDLDSEPAQAAFTGSIEALQRLYDLRPEAVACDAHPDYLSTRWAGRSGTPCVAVQHHYAHVLSGMADNRLETPVLGVAFDGGGYGLDGTVWGGEFLRVGSRSFERVAWLRTFALPGGERAVREPRRSALGALFELRGSALFDDAREPALGPFSLRERQTLARMLAVGLNCPRTSSAGRLFDAVAALCGLRSMSRYEGEAAMALEAALGGTRGDQSYSFVSRAVEGGLMLDWGPLLEELRRDLAAGVAVGEIALRFHNTLAEMIVSTALRSGERRVVLTGGCFQNRYLSERTIARLREAGLEPYWHERIPPGDGGLAVGQLLAAARELGQG